MQGEDKKLGGWGKARELQQMLGGIMIVQDQRVKEVVTWAMVGRVKSGFIDTWLFEKRKGGNFTLVGYFSYGALCHVSNELLNITDLVR